MKDPLQTIQTPYEILKVDPGSGKSEIDKAFMVALTKGVPHNIAKQARDILVSNPVERAWFEYLGYNDQSLMQLSPSLSFDPAAFQPDKRATTAKTWESTLRHAFPNIMIAHSLAVFWYWWVMYEEQRISAILDVAGRNGNLTKSDFSKASILKCARKAEGISCNPGKGVCSIADCPWKNDCQPTIPSTREMWERVIAYWGMLTANISFWNTFQGLDSDEAGILREKAIALPKDSLWGLLQKYQQFGDYAPLTEQYRDLELALSMEFESARLVDRAGLKTNFGKICCGRLMLTQMKMLDVTRSAVDKALAGNPKEDHLRRLQALLSPYAMISVLIDKGKPEEALNSIKKLSSEEKASKEIKRLQVRALHILAKLQISLEQVNEALDNWGKALRILKESDNEEIDKAIDAEIRNEIVKACLASASKLGENRRNEAIALLEKGFKLVSDDKLKSLLAELIMRRGIETFLDAQHKLEQDGKTEEILNNLKRGLADLQKATKLGSKEAAEQAKIADSFIQQVNSGLFGLPQEVMSLLGRAGSAAEMGDWDTAINCMKEVLRILGDFAPDTFRQNLSVCYFNRGMEKVNRGIEILNKSAPNPVALVEKMFSQLYYDTDHCAMCKKYIPYNEKRFSLPVSGRDVTLCAHCGNMLFGALNRSNKPDPQALSLIKSGETDLVDAAKYNPLDNNVKERLCEVREVLNKLSEANKTTTDVVVKPKKNFWSQILTWFWVLFIIAMVLSSIFGNK